MNSRHGPLHACGISFLAISHIIYRRSQDLNGPLASTCRSMAKLAKFASPLICAMQYQCLIILSFFDNHILTAETIIQNIFPPSAHVFDKIDEIVRMIMALPEKFDDALNKFPAIIHQFPFMEWVLVQVISWLNCVICKLNRWGLENSRIKEITIDIDHMNSNSCENKESGICMSRESFPSISESEKRAVAAAESSSKKGTYKEALERGKEEAQRKKTDGGEEIGEKEDNESTENEENESLLELFDSGWLMKPVAARSRDNSFTREPNVNTVSFY